MRFLGYGRLRFAVCAWHFPCSSLLARLRECHALPRFPRIDREHPIDGYENISRHAAKTGLEFNIVIAHFQAIGRVKTNVKHNLPILNKFSGHLNGFIHTYRNMGGQPIVATPFIQGAQQIRLGRGGFQFSLLKFPIITSA
ncbi:hypothetical protein ADJ79_08305 [Ottowia sp. oral taxon 894]|nr:hypothetical protein ADJ79_08305 [Ottowia sp. oral taxon 894]